jgi:hypothetical protein
MTSFNISHAGDFVDRGSWGLEELLLLLAMKLTLPKRVFLLRGNHESSTCTRWYGFKGEVDAKFTPVELRVDMPCTFKRAGPFEQEVPPEPGTQTEMMPAVCTPLAKPHPDAKVSILTHFCSEINSVICNEEIRSERLHQGR